MAKNSKRLVSKPKAASVRVEPRSMRGAFELGSAEAKIGRSRAPEVMRRVGGSAPKR